MKRHQLGTSPLYVTDICLGTMTWGMQNTEQQAHAQLDYAIKRGVNFIDTAEGYPAPMLWPAHQPGLTELYIGNYLSKHPGLRKSLVIATKVTGYSLNSPIAHNRYHPQDPDRPPNPPDCRLDARSIRHACLASLRRLQTHYIDLFQIHWPDRYMSPWQKRAYDPQKERESVPIAETLSALKTLLDEGKIRAYGLSNETTYGVAEYVRAADRLGMPRPASIQNQYCLFNRSFETELAEACAPSRYNIALLPYCILAGGALSGKYLSLGEAGGRREGGLKEARLFKYEGFMKRFFTEAAESAVRKYKAVAEEAGVSVATLAQAFCKSRFFVTSSIIGATNLKQLEENIDAFEVTLEESVLEKIDAVYNENKDFVWQV